MKIPLNLPLESETFYSLLLKRDQGDFLTSRVANPIQEGETDFDIAGFTPG
jgi:hypothetical protein